MLDEEIEVPVPHYPTKRESSECNFPRTLDQLGWDLATPSTSSALARKWSTKLGAPVRTILFTLVPSSPKTLILPGQSALFTEGVDAIPQMFLYFN